jgi:hypothetical protein
LIGQNLVKHQTFGPIPCDFASSLAAEPLAGAVASTGPILTGATLLSVVAHLFPFRNSELFLAGFCVPPFEGDVDFQPRFRLSLGHRLQFSECPQECPQKQ